MRPGLQRRIFYSPPLTIIFGITESFLIYLVVIIPASPDFARRLRRGKLVRPSMFFDLLF